MSFKWDNPNCVHRYFVYDVDKSLIHIRACGLRNVFNSVRVDRFMKTFVVLGSLLIHLGTLRAQEILSRVKLYNIVIKLVIIDFWRVVWIEHKLLFIFICILGAYIEQEWKFTHAKEI